jgi:alcohol dehydrogenase class IV
LKAHAECNAQRLYAALTAQILIRMSSISQNWSFQFPTRVIFGECLSQITSIVSELGAKRALIITGKTAMKKHGVTARLTELLKPVESEVFDEVEPNPAMLTFEKAQNAVKQHNCDLVIGLGGGSPLDVAKVAAAIGNKDQSPSQVFISPTKIASKGLPMIAIATTSGTGSEVTPFSILSDPENGTKKAAGHPFLYPTVALVDPSLCKTMTRDITAETGLDAISHAIESYWAKKASPITDSITLEALGHLLLNIRKAWEGPSNIVARSEMALGAMEAGIALGNTMATAAHSISYPLTVRFNIPHGLACALTLPLFVGFNAPAIDSKMPRLLHALGVKSVGEAVDSLTKLMVEIGQPTRLSDLGIGEDDLPWLVEHGFVPARMANNPREVAAKDVEAILKQIL